MLKDTVQAVLDELKAARKENNFLRTQVNLCHYQRDSLSQYGRREAFRLNKLEEKEKENPTDEIIEKANFILSKIDADGPFKEFKGKKITSHDIQRCHRVGDKDKAVTRGKPRPIIAKFKCYKLRMAILINKKKLQLKKEYSNQGLFITEDLTPFRNKLLWYTKNKCLDENGKNMFIHTHTREGKIKTKKASDPDAKNWITITSPDDFHRLGHDVDIKIINKDFHDFQILDSRELNPLPSLQDFPLCESDDE